ncbi:hypothetical protein [Bradyrhizobium sp. YR681]|uniref:hypothetical protein n=1 Tax=Bradyrhizobium sp. YR681 TaxID=1144344 RepID=UPI00055C8E11|nr:hypothetical protein [Bradyrhizobium sp. YR681]
MTRWEALVRFDDEISEAAAKLLPFGLVWIDRMGEAFFALNEDRKYLSNIVAGLVEEATLVARYEALQALEAERAEATQWAKAISRFPDGEEVSKDALAILIELRARGFLISNDRDGTVRVAMDGRGTSYVRSNADVVRLGQIFIREPR